MAMSGFTLPLMLSVAVPLEIERLRQFGGPTDADYSSMAGIVDRLGNRGDVLLFGGPKGEPARLFSDLARALAVMAFLPGGVTAFGQTWEAAI